MFGKDQLRAASDYIKSIHESLLDSQEMHQTSSDLFKFQGEVTPGDRTILVDWLLIVHVEFRLLPETIQTTVNLIDRYLSRE